MAVDGGRATGEGIGVTRLSLLRPKPLVFIIRQVVEAGQERPRERGSGGRLELQQPGFELSEIFALTVRHRSKILLALRASLAGGGTPALRLGGLPSSVECSRPPLACDMLRAETFEREGM